MTDGNGIAEAIVLEETQKRCVGDRSRRVKNNIQTCRIDLRQCVGLWIGWRFCGGSPGIKAGLQADVRSLQCDEIAEREVAPVGLAGKQVDEGVRADFEAGRAGRFVLDLPREGGEGL